MGMKKALLDRKAIFWRAWIFYCVRLWLLAAQFAPAGLVLRRFDCGTGIYPWSKPGVRIELPIRQKILRL